MTTTITLPEINISNELDWNEEMEIKVEQAPPVPVHQPTPSESDAESITTGLTRALSLPRQLNKEEERKEVINISTSNPSHLFWVPASQHPEIAPAEFEKYVDTHGLMINRKKSVKRRQSILSVYFTANDQQQQKFLDDLAKMDTDRQAALDVLEKSRSYQDNESDEDSHRKKLVMRRSVSLHLPTVGDYVRNVPDLLVFDRNSSPLDESRALVPKGDRPLLRRGARTNFKRNSSVTASTNRPVLRNRKSESDYMNSSQEEEVPMMRSSSADGGVTLSDDILLGKKEDIEQEQALSPVAEISEDVRDLCIATRELTREQPPIIMSRSASTSTATSNSSRKSSWLRGFWSDEKSKKSNKIDTEEPEEIVVVEPQVSKSTDIHTSNSSSSSSGGKRFTLSSLFSRKSKHGNTSNTANASVHIFNTTNNLNAVSLAPKDFQLNNRMFMTRLPLHVERAIYKLSHIKLANPRRPLHEQVLISNQMFWYLSVIAANPPTQQQVVDQIHHQSIQQQKKKPKKLVKKHRPKPPQQQPHKQTKKESSKLNNGVMGGFMANNTSESSTGFVVPENYLNPKYQPKKKGLYDNNNKEWDHKQSDSSSDDDDDDPIVSSSEEEEDLQKEDDIPLGLWKR